MYRLLIIALLATSTMACAESSDPATQLTNQPAAIAASDASAPPAPGGALTVTSNGTSAPVATVAAEREAPVATAPTVRVATNDGHTDSRFVAGEHYQVVEPAQPTSSGDRIEVSEVFGYLCPHCADFQRFIVPWENELDKDEIAFRRIPAAFNPSWEVLARVYMTAEVLGVAEAGHQALFDAIHVEQRRFSSIEQFAEFYTDYGVEADQFLATATSFPVETAMARNNTMLMRHGVTGTPSILINGKYRTSAVMTGGYPTLLEVMDYLISKEAAEQ